MSKAFASQADLADKKITFEQLSGYDGVILSDVPAHQLGDPLMNALRDYVDKLGGGLIMLGGPGSFVIPIKDRNQFKEAIRTKLVLEVAGRVPPARVIPAVSLRPRAWPTRTAVAEPMPSAIMKTSPRIWKAME